MTNPHYIAPEVELATKAAIPDPLPTVLQALQDRPDLAQWIASTNPRPKEKA